jgi:hypothetical protein
MKIQQLTTVFAFAASCGLLPGNPTDSSSNSLLDVEAVYARRLSPPEGSEVSVRFDVAVDPLPTKSLANYSLRQVSLELGGGFPGGRLEDLDGDGDLDMVVVLYDKIIAYENVGSATLPRYSNVQHFLALVQCFEPFGFDVAGFDVSINFVDLDGDEDRDIICGEGYDGQVSCFIRGGGPTGWPGSGDYGIQKKIMAQSGSTRFQIETSTADSGLNFDLAVPNLVLENLDVDGNPDLIVGDPQNPWGQPSNIIVYRGTGEYQDGAPVFNQGVALRAGGSPITIDWTDGGATCPVFHDVDGDGDRDLMVSTSNGEIWVYKVAGMNTDSGSDNYGLPLYGAGTLLLDTVGQPLELGWVSALQVVDFSNDGDKDLVVVSSGSSSFEENRMRVLENLSASGLVFEGRPTSIGISGHEAELRATYTSKAAFFDFDSDGKIDVLYTDRDYGMAIAYNLDTGNDHDPTFGVPVVLAMPQAARDLLSQGVPQVADFDGDKVLDPLVDGILVGTQTDLVFVRFSALLPNGISQFEDPVSVLPFGFPALHFIEPALGDMDNNGTLDVVIGTGTRYFGENRSLQLLTNSSSSGFTLAAAAPVLVGGASISTVMFPEIVDYDGDTDLDILVSDRSASFNSRQIAAGTIRLLRNDAGSFENGGLLQTTTSTPVTVPSDAAPRVVDFNEDQRLDLMVTSRNSAVTAFMTDPASTGPGLAPLDASPTLKVTATLPDTAELDGTGRNLTLSFGTVVHIGSTIDINDLKVSGQRCALSTQEILDYFGDSDDDGLLDSWEILHFSNLAQSGSGNADLDGLSNQQEWELGTNPLLTDTDGDGAADGILRYELEYDQIGRLNSADGGAAGAQAFVPDAVGNVEQGDGMAAGTP